MAATSTGGGAGAGLMPKEETGALAFVREHSSLLAGEGESKRGGEQEQAEEEWDGRGVVVGILDTGVDPGAIGLQRTSHGLPKVVDIVDCTGSGDVDTSTVASAEEGAAGRTIKGASGRTLTLHKDWVCPSGRWHVGVKRAYELFPKGLQRRVTKERKKAWTEAVQRAELELQRAIGAAGASAAATTEDDSGSSAKELKDLEDRLAQLREMDSNYQDPGPVYDCIVFHTGERWMAAVDTSNTGDFSEVQAMGNYRDQQEFGTFTELDSMNYGFNIFDEGNVLSIVVDAGAHGSHVAGIVAGYHPGQPELNGVAPGAQIVSLKIGDSRLGSMETGVGLMRALIDAVRTGCDVLNMSYGEAAALANRGRFVKQAEETVLKHGIMFVSSAGNNGPCLSTVGAPGGTSTALIGVAAYVSEAMMHDAYSLHEPTTSTNYTWSSVGPTTDGALGVSIMAPGGAIASVPNWCYQKNQLMNGTSMSSPNACGCVALLLSALKAQGIAYRPPRVRRALENTARHVDGISVLGQGNGLVQVPAAMEYLRLYQDVVSEDYHFDIQVQGATSFSKRGIYLRHPSELTGTSEIRVSVEAKLHDSAPAREKIEFELDIQLRTTVDWVRAADHLRLMHNGRSFVVSVDPTELEVGKVHTGFIDGYDALHPAKGPLFRVPVTVIKPVTLPPHTLTHSLGQLSLEAGARHRHFLLPPRGATWCDVVLTDQRQVAAGGVNTSAHLVVVHALQLLPHTPYRDNEKETYVQLAPAARKVVSFPVHTDVPLELCLSQYWTQHVPTDVDVSLTFRGVNVFPSPAVTLLGGGSHTLLRVHADLRAERIAPSGKLGKLIQHVRPTGTRILPLGERDVLPNGTPLYQLLLSYTFHKEQDGDVTPHWGAFNGVLYESGFEAQFYMIFDSSKRFVGCGDAWPNKHTLKAGNYTLRFQVRHDNTSLLENYKNAILRLEHSLSSKVSLSFYGSHEALATRGTTFSSRTLQVGSSAMAFVKEPDESDLPKGAHPGNELHGTVTYVQEDNTSGGATQHPEGFPVVYLIPPASHKTKPTEVTGVAHLGSTQTDASSAAATAAESTETTGSAETKNDDATATPPPTPDESIAKDATSLEEAVRDLKVSRVRGLVTESAERFAAMYGPTHEAYPTHLPLQQCLLHHLDSPSQRATSLARIIDTAESIATAIDRDTLAQHLGRKAPKENTEEVQERKRWEEKKSILVDALGRKAKALTTLLEQQERGVSSTATEEAKEAEQKQPEGADDRRQQLQDTVHELERWGGYDRDDSLLSVFVAVNAFLGRHGAILKRVNRLLAGGEVKNVKRSDLRAARANALRALGWNHIVDYDATWALIDQPGAFPLF